MTLYTERQRLVQRYIHQLVKEYVERHILGRAVHRPCVFCGGKFQPRSSRHVCCTSDCRRQWYRGQFFPRTD